TDIIRSDINYDGVSAHPHAPGCGRKNVRADGSDSFARATGRDDFFTHIRSSRSLHLARQETFGKGERFHPSSETLLCAAARSNIAETRTYPERRRNRAGS